MGKQRGKVTRGVSRPVGAPPSRRPTRRRQSPLLVLALVAGTLAALALILVFAFSRGGATTAPATPGATPGRPTPTPITGPLPNIGMLDPSSVSGAAGTPPKVGTKAPDFAWQTVKGHTSLSALRGHPVLLEFYGPWCPACQGESTWLNKLLKTYGPKGLEVLSVTGSPYGIDWEVSNNTAPVAMYDLLRYQRSFNIQYQQVLDANTLVFNRYGRGANFPTYYVIDRQGIVRFGTSIAVSEAQLTAQVRAVL